MSIRGKNIILLKTSLLLTVFLPIASQAATVEVPMARSYVMGLSEQSDAGYKDAGHCRGIRISQKQVLTSAHCAYKLDRSSPRSQLYALSSIGENQPSNKVVDIHFPETTKLSKDPAMAVAVADLAVVDLENAMSSPIFLPRSPQMPDPMQAPAAFSDCGILTDRKVEKEPGKVQWRTVFIGVTLDLNVLKSILNGLDLPKVNPDMFFVAAELTITNGDSGAGVICKNGNQTAIIGVVRAVSGGPIVGIQNLAGYESWIQSMSPAKL
jgi:hypothetical protein